MPSKALWRVSLAGVSVLCLTAAYSRLQPAPVMSSAATAFLASLTPEQAAQAKFAFTDDQRFDWHFIPKPRKGLPLKEMSPHQKHLASALLSSGLSQQGYIKATTIMSLEDVLRILEKDDGQRRNPEGYFFSVFGDPSPDGTWGFRIEGHHLSQNFTVVKGRIASSPSFFGANPAQVKEGPRKGLRALAREEDLGRTLFQALDAGQRKVALVSETAYKDIFTMADREAALKGQPSGLSAGKLNSKQKEMLMELIGEYANNVPEAMAQTRMEQAQKAGDQLYFAWAGGGNVGDPHYYRIQAPQFLIEYDDTQNNANHIHSVWRDLTNDFGRDLLKEHYQSSRH